MNVRFGLIGCGRISERHITSISQCNGAELAAVSDLYDARMEELERLYRLKTGNEISLIKYREYQALLARPDIDAVIVTTSSGLHARIALEALHSGKHVVLEKPIALSIEDADQIIALAESQKLHVLVCHQLRYRPIIRKIKQYIDHGALGKLYLGAVALRIFRAPEYYAAAPWRGSWAEDGGMLINQGIHLIDLLQWFLGDVQQVQGQIVKGSSAKETEDVAVGMLSFTNKAVGIIETNTITYPKNMEYGISLFGEKGTISIGGRSLDQIIRWSVADDPFQSEAAEAMVKQQNEHQLMYQDLIDAIHSGNRRVLSDAREGKRPFEIICALYQSALINLPVSLPLTSFSTASMKGLQG